MINSGSSKDLLLQELLREFVFVTTLEKMEVVVRFVSGSLNKIPDILSRIHTVNPKYVQQFSKVKQDSWQELMFQCNCLKLNIIGNCRNQEQMSEIGSTVCGHLQNCLQTWN